MAIGQSAGAGGAGIAIVNGVAQVGGAAVSLGSAGLAWLKKGRADSTMQMPGQCPVTDVVGNVSVPGKCLLN
jgi:hypothetical protein